MNNGSTADSKAAIALAIALVLEQIARGGK